eukprot:TRINITY_DN36721_c0_g1_i1.p3 TRINITY_DN36721_c0_g1~~TRINITY_DN36721_c0_g1_i1.p3  ORF type:complete len:138 (+),score=69.32 TRINITY_DN36721_c0_g1_i1:61-414(+)
MLGAGRRRGAGALRRLGGRAAAALQRRGRRNNSKDSELETLRMVEQFEEQHRVMNLAIPERGWDFFHPATWGMLLAIGLIWFWMRKKHGDTLPPSEEERIERLIAEGQKPLEGWDED